eukprot:3667302-Amphidinium_carterae.2
MARAAISIPLVLARAPFSAAEQPSSKLMQTCRHPPRQVPITQKWCSASVPLRTFIRTPLAVLGPSSARWCRSSIAEMDVHDEITDLYCPNGRVGTGVLMHPLRLCQ